MDVDEDYMFDNQTMEELGIDSLDEGTLVGSDDLVEYSAGEEDLEEETVYIKTEESFEEPAIPKTMITSPNITVKRVVNNKPIVTPTNLTKIAPKPANFVRATNAAGKVVYIQKQSGTVAPVKLLNNAKSPTATSTTSYHLVKGESGVVMQPKVQTMIRRVVPAASTSTTTTASSLNKPKSVTRPATHVVIHTKMGPSGTSTTKTLTVAEAHQMGLLNNKAKQVVQVEKPKPIGISSAIKSPVKVLPGSSTSTIVRLKQSPGATSTGQVQRISTITKPAVQSQKVVLPQSAIQVGQKSGQIQAINIPGKGIQYVRFLNQNTGSTSASTSGHKVVQVMNKSGNASIAGSGSKIIVQNNKTYVVSNGNVTAVRAASSGQQANQTRVLTSGGQTVVRRVLSASSSQAGVVKRDPESTRYIAVVRKDDGKPTEAVTNLTAAQLNQLSGTTVMAGGSKTKIVMVPSTSTSVTNQIKSTLSGSSSVHSNPSIISVKRESISGSEDETRKGPAVGTIFPDEAYKKRPCNCTKSQCLKLYCDCFANGEFCYNCNCRDCYNNLDNEEERQKAIRATLERNPSAFKPKIGAVSADEDALRLHTKGCNCKRSGCLKNYCECYEAKIACSANCKCIGCRNTEQYAKEFEYATSLTGVDSVGGVVGGNLEPLSGDDSMAEVSQSEMILGGSPSDIKPIGSAGGAFAETKPTTSAAATVAIAGIKRPNPAEPDLTQLPPSKQPYNFMTPDVIEATVQCMIAQADECQKRGCNIRTAERMILEEFGRCLVEIIEFSSKSDS
ncbi:protein lin-54 homolog [Aedes aegypti]|uniref:CRC domain-containing protein n=1 Tax=Aedes aegypti TaxID=7159 RepID=A0A1S4FBW1_AEDAE|nr:protein lin-54 homolog [Aedes aegypti]